MITITPSELKKQLERNEVFLIDIRKPMEYKVNHIEGAFLMPLNNNTMEKLSTKKGPIVLYCTSGKISAHVCKELLKTNPSLDIASLEGGIEGWIQEGYSVHKSLFHFYIYKLWNVIKLFMDFLP